MFGLIFAAVLFFFAFFVWIANCIHRITIAIEEYVAWDMQQEETFNRTVDNVTGRCSHGYQDVTLCPICHKYLSDLCEDSEA